MMLHCLIPFPAEAKGIEFELDGEVIELQTPPELVGETALVPMREIYEKLGIASSWDAQSRSVSAKTGQGDVLITADKDSAVVNQVSLELPMAVKQKNEELLIPLSLLEDSLKTEAEYLRDSEKIRMKTPEQLTVPEPPSQEEMMSKLPEGISLIAEDELFNGQPNNANAVAKTVEVEGMPFTKALSLETKALPGNAVPTNAYDMQYVMHNSTDFMANDVGLISFWVRATEITDESGFAFVAAVMEENWGSFAKVANTKFEVSNEWRKVYAPITSQFVDCPVGKAQITLRIGYKAQKIEVADFKAVNFKDKVPVSAVDPESVAESYEGMEEDALWRKEAYRRIEKYRKEDIHVKVTDAGGNPVANAEVRADMTKNEFLFGTAVTGTLFKNTADAEKYREAVKKYFNCIVPENDMKWKFLLKDDGANAIRTVNWGIENGLAVRGHNILWDSGNTHIPPSFDYKNMTEDQALAGMKEHINQVITTFKGRLLHWDFINEPTYNFDMRQKYGVDFYGKMSAYAKKIDPDTRFYVNETAINGMPNSIGKRFEGLLEEFKENGVSVDGVGIESHFALPFYPQVFYNEIDSIAEHTDEIAITEYDFTPRMESITGPFLRDMLITAYSQPKARGFLMWGFWDGQHWRKYAPLFEEDWTRKDGARVWEKLVLNDWMTHETAITDDNGNAVIRGFRGDYDIAVTVGGKTAATTLVLSEDGENTVTARADSALQLTSSQEVRDNRKLIEEKTLSNTILSEVDENQSYGMVAATCSEGYPAEHTLDGKAETFWATASPDGWVQYELDAPLGGELTVTWYNAVENRYVFRVETSADGEKWETLEFGGSGNDPHRLQIKSGVRYLRIANNQGAVLAISDVTFQKK